MFAGKFVPSGNETDGTGMHSPAGTDLAITTSGINRVYVDVSGNVGLSSLAPSCALDVNFNDAVGELRVVQTENVATSAAWA